MSELRIWLAVAAAIVACVAGLFAVVRALRPTKPKKRVPREDDDQPVFQKQQLQFAPYAPDILEDLSNYDLDDAFSAEAAEHEVEQEAAVPAAQLRLQETFETYRNAPAERWDALLHMGDMYARGAFPAFSPNTDIAEMCYRAAAMCPRGDVAGLAQMKLLELKVAPIPLEDTAGSGLPASFGVQAYNLAVKAIQTTPWTAFETPRFMPKREDEKENLNNQKKETKNLDSEARVHAEMAARQAEEQAARRRQQMYKQDAQNVHDHAVTQAVDRNLRDLADKFSAHPSSSDEGEGEGEGEGEEDIRLAVADARRTISGRKDIAAGVRRQALRVLDGLSSSKHSKFGKSERETLALVWRQVTSDATDDATRGDLVETLAKQLASSVENGLVVCSSGKIARITGALDGVSNQTGVRPLWAVREEIGTLAAKMRDDPAFSSTEQSARAFEKAVRRTYIDELGMSPLILEPVIKEYADAF